MLSASRLPSYVSCVSPHVSLLLWADLFVDLRFSPSLFHLSFLTSSQCLSLISVSFCLALSVFLSSVFHSPQSRAQLLSPPILIFSVLFITVPQTLHDQSLPRKTYSMNETQIYVAQWYKRFRNRALY